MKWAIRQKRHKERFVNKYGNGWTVTENIRIFDTKREALLDIDEYGATGEEPVKVKKVDGKWVVVEKPQDCL